MIDTHRETLRDSVLHRVTQTDAQTDRGTHTHRNPETEEQTYTEHTDTARHTDTLKTHTHTLADTNTH